MSDAFKELFKQGTNYFAQGRYEEAKRFLLEALALNPSHAPLNYYLGTVAEEEKDFDQAETYYEKVLACDPTMRQAYVQLAHVLFFLGKKEKALVVLRAAEKRFENSHDLTYMRGQVASQLFPGWHLPMLADQRRNDLYEAAINAQVRPGDVVLDIGTGSGLLAMMAARAGAAHVYAFEAQPMIAQLARDVIAQNGLADKITVIAKHSTQAVLGQDLPQKCDVLVTEIFDRALVGEGALPSIAHAQAELLKPMARVVPQGARLYGALIECDHLQRFHHIETVNGFDLSAMNVLSHPLLYKEALLGPQDSPYHQVLSTPFLVKAFDFEQPLSTRFNTLATVSVVKEGQADAILLWFELQLNAEHVLSTKDPAPDSHWREAAQILLKRPQLQMGTTLDIKTSYNGYFDFQL